jgi:methyl-accepting chemotaxis protein
MTDEQVEMLAKGLHAIAGALNNVSASIDSMASEIRDAGMSESAHEIAVALEQMVIEFKDKEFIPNG